MAKTTATIFGLVLAAVSIGVNISRYPIVWQMADPRLAGLKAWFDRHVPAEARR